jgi:type I restriction enzyme M protein
MTNPPFTGSIDKADKSDRFALDTNKTELLFIELLLDLLVPSGRAGVILPEGVLFGSTRAHRELRRRLVWDNQLDAVISLPAGVFQPYTGVKTSILIFTKGGDQNEQRAEPLTKKVWLYEIENDGYSLDARRLEQPEQNDLWDLPVKFKLVKQQPAPIWIDDARWVELRALPPNELRMDYF